MMRDLRGKTAVVTGAASGIGLALAERFAAEGMHLVMADVEEPALRKQAERIAATGVRTLLAVTDVSDWDNVRALAETTYERFGGVHVLCNNAGVGGEGGGGAGLWNRELSDWQWVLGVNLWGVIHGVHAFVPRMIASGEEGYVVNTASVAGLFGANNIYGVSKHAVVALTEALRAQLIAAKAKIGVSVVCPGVVSTNIYDSARNRPAGLAPQRTEPPEAAAARRERDRERLAQGLPPADVANAVIDAMREERFYVLPIQPEWEEWFPDAIRRRAENIVERRNPS